MTDLVGNPEDRFSQNEANLLYGEMNSGLDTFFYPRHTPVITKLLKYSPSFTG